MAQQEGAELESLDGDRWGLCLMTGGVFVEDRWVLLSLVKSGEVSATVTAVTKE
mgnify:CR=1 FL=1